MPVPFKHLIPEYDSIQNVDLNSACTVDVHSMKNL